MRAPLEVPQRGMFSRNLVLDDEGVRRGKRLLAWADVDHYTYDWQDWTRPGDIVLVATSGPPVRVAPYFNSYPVTADRLFGALHPILRRRPRCSPFTLDEDALALGGDRCPLAAVAYLEVASVGPMAYVIVHLRDGGQWERVEAMQVADLWLLLELLIERGVVLRSSIALHLPPALATIQTAVDAETLLPAARVVRRP